VGGEIPFEVTDPFLLPTIFADVGYETSVNFTLIPQSNILPIGAWTINYDVADFDSKSQRNISLDQIQLDLSPEFTTYGVLDKQTTGELETDKVNTQDETIRVASKKCVKTFNHFNFSFFFAISFVSIA